MSTTRELHNASMEYAESALIARLKHDDHLADQRFRQALELEIAALEALPQDGPIEPTRSILLRSAATLALDCNDIAHAERLIARGLADNGIRRALTKECQEQEREEV